MDFTYTSDGILAPKILDIDSEAPDFSFAIVENIGTNPTILNLTYLNKSTPRLKANGDISTMLEMNNLMSKSLEIISPLQTSGVINYFNTVGNCSTLYYPSGIWFAPDFPEFLYPVGSPNFRAAPQAIPNVITWGVVRQEPGGTEPFRGTREVNPRIREFIAIFGPEIKRYVSNTSSTDMEQYGALLKFITIKAQSFDNLVQYNIWSKTNYEVECLTEWFMYDYMDRFKGMFREAGIVNMWFDRRIRDDTIVAMKSGYHVRSVLYYVRTERLAFDSVGPIKRLNLNVFVRDLQNLVTEVGGLKIDSDLQAKLVDKWINKNKFGG